MKRFRFLFAGLAIAVFCLPVFSQLNLNYLYSRGVNSRLSACTKIDSVLIDTKVANGVATTMLTMTITPDLYWQCSYISQIIDSTVLWVTAAQRDSAVKNFGASKIMAAKRGNDTVYQLVKYTYSSGYTCSGTGQIVDSVEITAGFYLPSDFIVKNLYLWVNGERQTGYIQDRALASQQYNKIVGVRRDPAILQFSGNGYYNLSIYPAKSLVSRKVAIEFQHTFNDDSLDFITAPLPFQFDSASTPSYLSNKKLPLGFMQVSASAADGRDYSLEVPGLGAGTFSSGAPLILQKNNVGKLGVGSIETKDPSGSYKFLWAAPDKNNKTTIGFSTMLSKSSVTLDPEPDTRIIVLDVQNENWNQGDYYTKNYQYCYPWRTTSSYTGYQTIDLLLRAKKSAILCLQTYIAQNQKFNIILTHRGAKSPSAVFESPVAPTDENLLIAYKAIVDAEVSASTSLEAMTKAIAQAPKGIVIFISDLYRPFDYGQYTDQNYSQYIVSDAGKQYDTLLAKMSRAVAASSVNLFTIGDEYKLTQIATSNGGYNLASLRSDSYYRKTLVYSSDGKQQTAIQLPQLFGTSYYNRGITGLKVVGPANVTECVFTADGYGYYYYDAIAGVSAVSGMMLDKKKAMAKTSTIVSPNWYYGDSTMFRLAAKLGSTPYSGTLDFTITGKMGGLGFTKKITADASAWQTVSDQTEQYGLWAFRKTEQLGLANWSMNADSIRWLGIDHHIVTRQTSLLALEPGMDLWKDTINPQQTSGENATVSADASGAASFSRTADSLSTNMNLDGISLEDIIAKKAAVLEKPLSPVVTGITLGFFKAGVKIGVPQSLGGHELAVSLFTLQGRLIATKRIATTQGIAGAYKVNFGNKAAGKGLYMVKARIGAFEKVLSMPIF